MINQRIEVVSDPTSSDRVVLVHGIDQHGQKTTSKFILEDAIQGTWTSAGTWSEAGQELLKKQNINHFKRDRTEELKRLLKYSLAMITRELVCD